MLLSALLNREPCENHGLTGNCKANPLSHLGKDLIIEARVCRNGHTDKAILSGPSQEPAGIKILFGTFPSKVLQGSNQLHSEACIFVSCRAANLTF